MLTRNEAMNIWTNGELEKVQEMTVEFEQCIWMMDCKTFELNKFSPNDGTVVLSWSYGFSGDNVRTGKRKFIRQVVQTSSDYLNSIKAYLYDLLVIVALG